MWLFLKFLLIFVIQKVEKQDQKIMSTLQNVRIDQGKKILLSVVCKVLVYQTLLYYAI